MMLRKRDEEVLDFESRRQQRRKKRIRQRRRRIFLFLCSVLTVLLLFFLQTGDTAGKDKGNCCTLYGKSGKYGEE